MPVIENIVNQLKISLQPTIICLLKWPTKVALWLNNRKLNVTYFKRLVRSDYFLLIGFVPALIAGFMLYITIPGIQEFSSNMMPPTRHVNNIVADSAEIISSLKLKEQEIAKLQKELNKLTPRANFIMINTTENRFKLYARGKLIREGICSTGSYTLLSDGKDKKWYFKTPKGIFRIRDKKTNPVWKKPDWAFVEEGMQVPRINDPSRFEYGTLGDYALSLGDGYLIHGTLYQRFLGLPVTHGCIRLGDEDLKIVFQTLQIGSFVYIY